MKEIMKNRHPAAFVVRCLCILVFLFSGSAASFAQAPKAVTQLTPADYYQIYNLYSEYAYALDTGNGAPRIATFTPDGVFKSPITYHQADPLNNLRKRTDNYGQRSRPGLMHHQMLNIHITPTAEGTWLLLCAVSGRPACRQWRCDDDAWLL
jgi:hypothetical protein